MAVVENDEIKRNYAWTGRIIEECRAASLERTARIQDQVVGSITLSTAKNWSSPSTYVHRKRWSQFQEGCVQHT